VRAASGNRYATGDEHLRANNARRFVRA